MKILKDIWWWIRHIKARMIMRINMYLIRNEPSSDEMFVKEYVIDGLTRMKKARIAELMNDPAIAPDDLANMIEDDPELQIYNVCILNITDLKRIILPT